MAAREVPRSIGSAKSPTGQEIELWKYDQLAQLPKQNLQTRSLDLKSIIQANYAGHCGKLRSHGPADSTILWILEAQALLLSAYGYSVSAHDFGYPLPENGIEQASASFEGKLPSIKMTKETILQRSPKPGPGFVHDP